VIWEVERGYPLIKDWQRQELHDLQGLIRLGRVDLGVPSAAYLVVRTVDDVVDYARLLQLGYHVQAVPEVGGLTGFGRPAKVEAAWEEEDEEHPQHPVEALRDLLSDKRIFDNIRTANGALAAIANILSIYAGAFIDAQSLYLILGLVRELVDVRRVVPTGLAFADKAVVARSSLLEPVKELSRVDQTRAAKLLGRATFRKALDFDLSMLQPAWTVNANAFHLIEIDTLGDRDLQKVALYSAHEMADELRVQRSWVDQTLSQGTQ
jgi:hypothetical protein